MTVKLSTISIILLVLAGLSAGLIYYVNTSVKAYEWSLKADKYIALNLNKNKGIKHHALILSRFILKFHPRPDYVEYVKSDKEAGITSATAIQFDLSAITSKIIRINNTEQLQRAFHQATAGDILLLSAGQYLLKGKRFQLKNPGTVAQPIRLMAESFGTVNIQMDSLEGLYLDQPFWVIRNLIFEGICQSDNSCEHAIHLTGNADNIFISNNRFINFNAHIKSNGKRQHFPDHVTISGNDFYNQSARNTNNPVTPIDVVGGNDWVIENNFIADFALQQRGKFTVTYGAFLKGGGERGKISNNVVNCAWKLPHQSFLDIRIGLSLGGGGTGGAFYRKAGGNFEHNDGIIENNLIINCSNDVGIYLNKAAKSEVNNNILLNTLGIDIRFNTSTATLENNQYQGRIKARDGSFTRLKNNVLLPLQ